MLRLPSEPAMINFASQSFLRRFFFGAGGRQVNFENQRRIPRGMP
jgi:hypothetical protein